MQKRMKKLAIMLLVGCLLIVAINAVSAEDSSNGMVNVSSYSELKNAIEINHNDVNLTQNITPSTGESFGNGINIGQNVTIDGNGYCIDANQTGRIFQITNSSAVLTLINITLMNGYKDNGGVIYSSNDVNLKCIGDVTFNNNTASKGYGSAIYANGDVVINVTGDVTFNNNTASGSWSGGAIYANGDVVINVTGDVTFNNNTASGSFGHGGAIYANGDVVINVTGDVTFNNNTAGGGGGAISADGGVVINVTGDVTFNNNTAGGGGGAISADGGVVINVTGDVTFNNNTASRDGGAIYADEVNVVINVTGDVTFNNNTAIDNDGMGGAIYANNGDVVINVTGDVTFNNNTASSKIGGAIYANRGVVINVTGDVTFNNNTASSDGGAIYANNGVVINVTGDVTFNNNTASNGGGAIYANNGVVINVTGDVTFNNNTASNGGGGAIYTNRGVVINVTGDVTFNNNTASNGGGAIYAYEVNVVINVTGDVTFNNNTAIDNDGIGGAIYAINGDVVINVTGDVTFNNNTASNNGGAIFTNTIHINKIILIFNNNTASIGKNIYIENLDNSIIDDCFWGLNYKTKEDIINDDLISFNGVSVAPDSWLLMNIIKPDIIAADINNTFKLLINQRRNGTIVEDIKSPFIAYIPVKLSDSTNTVPSIAIGYFNFTTDHVGDFTIHVFNIFNNKEITNITFTTDNSPFSKVAELIKENTTINLEKNYNYYQELDYKLANGIKITRNTTIDGNGHYLDAKNLATIFQVNKGVTLTLKNIRLLNANIAIVNNGVLDLTNVTSNSAIRNNGIITSGVKFIVYSDKLTTYDSFLVSLRTVDGIPIMVSNLKYSDDQGHNYKAYIYNKGYYVNYVPEGITGHVTFNNVELNGFTNLTSTGSLDITKYPQTSNNFVSNIVKSVSDKIIKNTVVKTPINILNNPVVKNINFIVKNTVKDFNTNIFKFLRA